MEIVCSTDYKYVVPTGIMICSLFENNKDEQINLHILHDKDSIKLLEPIKNLASQYRQNIYFHCINNDTFHNFPIGLDYQLDHVGTSLATYYRLLLTELLPSDIDKVIYLDSDIIVTDHLTDLWNTDISQYALGAVPDSYNNQVMHYNRLRYSQSLGYFNAGMLLINLKYWREHHAVAHFMDYIKQHPERLRCHDQDVLNAIFKDAKFLLPLRYNMLNEYWYDLHYNPISWEYEQQIIEGQKHPAIIHFTCIPKPWYKNCHHPHKKTFDYYKSHSPWHNIPEKRWWSVYYHLEKIAVRLVVALGLRKSDYIDDNKYISLS